MKKSSIELVEHELTPGVFDPSHLPQFGENDATVKRAYGNLDYFIDLNAGESLDSAYWRADINGGDRGQADLLSYVALGSLRINVANKLVLESIDRLRETVDGDEAALLALNTVMNTVKEKDHQDRELQARKIGESIVERLNFYHLLLDDSQTGSDDYEITGKFAHLRGLALDGDGAGLPVVFGESGTLGTLPGFQQTQLYFG